MCTYYNSQVQHKNDSAKKRKKKSLTLSMNGLLRYAYKIQTPIQIWNSTFSRNFMKHNKLSVSFHIFPPSFL